MAIQQPRIHRRLHPPRTAILHPVRDVRSREHLWPVGDDQHDVRRRRSEGFWEAIGFLGEKGYERPRLS